MDAYRGLSKKAYGVLLVNAVLQCVFILLALCAGLWALGKFTAVKYEYENYDIAALIILCAALVLCVIYTAIAPKLRHAQYKYLITSDRIEICEGIVFKKRTIVPIDRIHQIDVTRGPIDTRFGVAKVTVTTAGGLAVFRFLEEEKANEIADYLNGYIKQKYTQKNSEDGN